ncbi:hypothetical protein [Pacificoceanicola onchidii]|uniref:hypothetical protein n=1 Tax=Pacificoceanicola onchidii TaxID=2562685 RepID=UPI0014561C60|nr:hypothetical protein [Pacificoceanicola onchidii]
MSRGKEHAAESMVAADVGERNVDEQGREIISIKRLLEWAFATECATLDFDEVGAALGIGLPGVSAEHRVGEMLAMGFERGEGVRPDTSFGRSHPHDDAELVATALRNAVPFDVAIWVAELARMCRVPRWNLGQPKLQPRAWSKRNHLGQLGKTEVCREVEYMQGRRKRVRQELWVPCVWAPSVGEVAAARRGYLRWWGALLSVRSDLRRMDLARYSVSDRMPPMQPWRNSC